MAVVNKYKCLDCGLDLADDGRVFIWDGKSKHTRDFLILMSTYELLDGAQIKGDVDVTYCRECDRYLRIYSIRHVQEGIEEPCELVMQGIENQIVEYGRQLQDLKEIKRKSLYTIERNDDHYEVEFP